MFLPIFPCHFYFIQMRKHSNLVYSLLSSPYYQRDFKLNSYLYRVNCLPGQTVPVNTSHFPNGGPCNFFYCFRIYCEGHNITVKPYAEISKISYSFSCIILLIVGNKQWIHSIYILNSVYNKVRISCPTYRNNTIIIGSR